MVELKDKSWQYFFVNLLEVSTLNYGFKEFSPIHSPRQVNY